MSRRLAVTILGANYAPEATGVAPYTAGLAQGLAARGHDVRVITAHPHEPAGRIAPGYGSWSADEELAGVAVHRVRHYVPARPTRLRQWLSAVTLGLRFALARWGRPDVVVLVSPQLGTAALAWARARLTGRRVGVWAQRLATLGDGPADHSGRSSVGRSLESAMLRSAAGVVMVHERFRDLAVHRLGLPAEQVEVIRNWSRVPPFPSLDPAAARGRLGWSAEETVVLHAGTIGPRQALEHVVEAARLADETNAPVRFVLLGDGPERARLAALGAGVRSLRFLDPLPESEFLQALASADILLVHERPGLRAAAVPSKLTTYFAAGLPVIAATDVASVAAGEVRVAGAGVSVEAGSPRHLLRAVLALRADPARCRSLGQSGRRYQDGFLGEAAALDHFERWLHRIAGMPLAAEYADAT